jgi:DNA polymerase-3 subunit delta'
LSWERIRGHDALIEGFRRVVRRGRLAHAYLFTGPPGVGKRRFAAELAKALLCETPPPDRLQACDHCPGCVQVEAGTHPDFFAVARPEEVAAMPIDVIRELGRNLSLKPVRGHGKVALIDDADDFDDPITSHAAANALLKTLEEPPPGSVLLLIGTSADRQLPTIRSRCQVVRFAPLPDDLVAELLRAQGVADDLRGRLVRLAGGSPGLALELADPALWEFRARFLAGLMRRPLDAVALGQLWSEFVEEAGKESAAQRRRAQVVLRLLIDLLDDALTLGLGCPPRRTGPEDRPTLEALAQQAGPDLLLALLERCLEADHQVDRRVQLVLVREALLDALAQKLPA